MASRRSLVSAKGNEMGAALVEWLQSPAVFLLGVNLALFLIGCS